MRIVFIGAVEFSRHCLQALLSHGAHIVGIFTPAPQHATFNADYADLAPVAKRAGIPVHHIKNINAPEVIDTIRSLSPDIIFVFGFSQLISQSILSIAPLGCIGTHPALLPKNRGRHPLIWALVEGLTETGLTFFYLDEGADTGDILWQRAFPITLEDDAGTLYEKIKSLAAIAISEFLPALQNGTAVRQPQDSAQATYWRKRTKADGQIDWSKPTMQTYNLIRALTHPYVGAHTFCEGREIMIWKSRLPVAPYSGQDHPPGTVLYVKPDAAGIKTGDGHLELLSWEDGLTFCQGQCLGQQPEGKKRG